MLRFFIDAEMRGVTLCAREHTCVSRMNSWNNRKCGHWRNVNVVMKMSVERVDIEVRRQQRQRTGGNKGHSRM